MLLNGKVSKRWRRAAGLNAFGRESWREWLPGRLKAAAFLDTSWGHAFLTRMSQAHTCDSPLHMGHKLSCVQNESTFGTEAAKGNM